MPEITCQTVICMKWGTLYGPEYVNRLYSMVRRKTKRPLRFVCFTDDSTGVDEGVITRNLPPISLPDHMVDKPWRKISLWQPDIGGLDGNALYLDLDLIVTGIIDDFFDYEPEANFCVIHNWTTRKRPETMYSIVGNTSCYRFRIGSHTYLYDQLQKNPDYFLNKYRNSQTYISNEITEMHYWPESWCVSFKHSLLPSWPKRVFVPATLPSEAKVVAFTGKPDIHDVIAGHWPEKNPLKRPFKRLVKPDWVETLWLSHDRA